MLRSCQRWEALLPSILSRVPMVCLAFLLEMSPPLVVAVVRCVPIMVVSRKMMKVRIM